MELWTRSVVAWGGGETYAGPEVRGVQLRVVLVLHGVIKAVALPHQVVVSAHNGRIHFGQLLERHKQTTTTQ